MKSETPKTDRKIVLTEYGFSVPSRTLLLFKRERPQSQASPDSFPHRFTIHYRSSASHGQNAQSLVLIIHNQAKDAAQP